MPCEAEKIARDNAHDAWQAALQTYNDCVANGGSKCEELLAAANMLEDEYLAADATYQDCLGNSTGVGGGN